MAHHNLKTKPEYFVKVLNGVKRAELRKNDRFFVVGDTLTLQEFNSCYTGRYINVRILDVSDVSDYAPGYVLLSIEGK